MKKPLRTLIYGQRHEHGPDKLAVVLAMPDDFEVVAVADDSSRPSPTYAICPTVLDGESLKVDMTLDRPVGGYEAGRHIVDFGVCPETDFCGTTASLEERGSLSR